MTRRLLFILVMTVCTVLCAYGQNSIDGMMEHFSSSYGCKFTSAVERDPATRKVQKVVKVLELYDTGIRKFVDAFRNEGRAENFTEKYDKTGCNMMFTTQNGRQSRIYMLRCSNPYNPDSRNTGYGYAKVTIIIKNKGGKQ